MIVNPGSLVSSLTYAYAPNGATLVSSLDNNPGPV